MSFEISSTAQYEIKNLTLITSYGSFDLRNIFVELNIFDHILQPCMSGKILIRESLALSSKFKFDGSEYILIEISKNEDALMIKKLFRIFKQTDRQQSNMTSESYVLHFVSDEYLLSQQQALNNSYQGTYSEVVQLILENKLGVTSEYYTLEQSDGVRSIIIPNLKPIDALIWCSKRAINDLQLPNFLFYENMRGYNFISLSTLKKQQVLTDILFEPKKIDGNIGREFFGARDVEVISQFDYLDNVQSGVYSGTFIGFDPVTRIIVEQQITFDDIFKDDKLNSTVNFTNEKNRQGFLNTEMRNSRKVVYPTAIGRENTQYIRDNDIESLNLKETPQYFAFQRKAIFKQLFSQRMKISLPGNFLITSGINLNLKKLKNSAIEDDTEDKSLYGNYLVVATRHIIRGDGHETLVEVVTDSTDINAIKPPMQVDVRKVTR